MPKLAQYKECTGCMACVDSCSHKALQATLNEEGHIVPLMDESKCVNCKLCERVCPVVSKLPYSQSPVASSFAGWAKDKVVRKNSATAGAFSALAQYVFSKGGVVCGASNVDGVQVKHICIEKVDELTKLQGSKYTQSNAEGIYKTVSVNLKQGKLVLFSGTGCQVAGLYGYLGKRKYSGRLITVDLICGGVPSRFLIDKFIECEPYQVKGIVSFRTKEHGWTPRGFKYNLKIMDDKGFIHDYTNERNLISTGFACEMTNRYSCYKCQFAGTHRMSDFTIGDYWGVSDFKEQHTDGVSAIIAHSEKSIVLLKDAHAFLEVHEANLSDIVAHNKRICLCKDNTFMLPERRFLSYTFQHFNYRTLKAIYAFAFGKYSPWMLYKIYRAVVKKIINKI